MTRGELGVRAACAVLGMGSVAALLGWVFGAAPFATLVLAVSLPSAIALVAISLLTSGAARRTARTVLQVGVAGGLLGTLGYDLFRVPFVLAGFRLFAPIESYGVLALDAATSSPLTAFAGWAYHASNGVCFGITYAALGLRRHWAWGVAFALALETGTIVTPFASAYGLSGKWVPIGIAYAAHVPFGLAIGLAAQHPERITATLAPLGRPALVLLLAAVGVLAVWHRPWTTSADTEAAAIANGRFTPEWVRVAEGGCVDLHNGDAASYRIDVAVESPTIPARSSRELCFAEVGVHRVHTDGRPYDGGFVIVDSEVQP